MKAMQAADFLERLDERREAEGSWRCRARDCARSFRSARARRFHEQGHGSLAEPLTEDETWVLEAIGRRARRVWAGERRSWLTTRELAQITRARGGVAVLRALERKGRITRRRIRTGARGRPAELYRLAL